MSKADRRAREAHARALDYLRQPNPKGGPKHYGLPTPPLTKYANALLGTKRARKVKARGIT